MAGTVAFASSGNTLAVSASGTSANGALPGQTTDPCAVRVYNGTTVVAFFRVSATASPVAVTTDPFVAPGATEVFSIPAGMGYVGVILASSTGTVYFNRGDGI